MNERKVRITRKGQTKMKKHSTICAGIDTGKHTLDVAIEGSSQQLQVKNTTAGHVALATWLREHRVKRVGIEASGGYEQAVVAHLRHDGFIVVVFQPAQVRAYAFFRLQRAKNDKIDAALIAACTAAIKNIHAPPDPRLVPFAGRLTMIEQIVEDMRCCKNRYESSRDKAIRAHWKEQIRLLAATLRTEFKRIVAEIRQHRDLAERLDLIESVPGIGLRTAVAILVRMPEIGRLTREQVAALLGVAPYDHDSGQFAGLRHIAGGRERLRGSLYNAALPAAFRWNPQIMALYQRLIAAGKPHKVALIACARKLIIYVNTVVQRATPWREQPPVLASR